MYRTRKQNMLTKYLWNIVIRKCVTMRRAAFYSKSGHVAFVMDNLALGQDFVSTGVSLLGIIPTLL
jgi:hypothetical protein